MSSTQPTSHEPIHERVSRRVGALFLALAALVGLAFGYFLREIDAPARAQQSPYGAAQSSPDALNDSIRYNAAPRVAFDGAGQAKFSRPLEVPPLYAFESPLGDGGDQQIVLVDSQTKRLCVYWIRRRDVNSTIELVATRSFEFDLKLDNFNGEGLAPSQIREQLESINR